METKNTLTIEMVAETPSEGGSHLFITHVFFNETTSTLRLRCIAVIKSVVSYASIGEITTRAVVYLHPNIPIEKIQKCAITIKEEGALFTITQMKLNGVSVDAKIEASQLVMSPTIDANEMLLYANMEPYLARFVANKVQLLRTFPKRCLPVKAWSHFPLFDSKDAKELIASCVSKFREGTLAGNEYHYFMAALWAIKEINAKEQSEEILIYPELRVCLNSIKKELNLSDIDFDEFKPALYRYLAEQNHQTQKALRSHVATPALPLEKKAEGKPEPELSSPAAPALPLAQKAEEKREPALSSNASSFWQQHKKGIVGAAAAVIVAGVALASCV